MKRPCSKDPEMLSYYDQRAPEYEQIYYRDDPVRQSELTTEATRLEQLARGLEVLDLACGTGWWLPRMGSAKSILAVDISGEMLKQARAKTAECSVSFVRGDLYCAPVRRGQFDLVTLGFWFSHHPKPDYTNLFEALTEPLRPSGLIWLIDNNAPAEGSTIQTVGYDEFGNRFAKRFLDNGKPYVILKNYFSAEELYRGFGTSFSVERLTWGRCYWSAVLKPR